MLKPLLLLPLLLLLFVSSTLSKSSDASQNSLYVASKLSINGHFGHNNVNDDVELATTQDLLRDNIEKKNSSKRRSLFGFLFFGWAIGDLKPKGPDFDQTEAVVVRPDFETKSRGKWRVTSKNVGVSAMQLQLMPNNKVVWFDTTYLGDSAYRLNTDMCPDNFERGYKDCFAHALQYDADTDETKPLNVSCLLCSFLLIFHMHALMQIDSYCFILKHKTKLMLLPKY